MNSKSKSTINNAIIELIGRRRRQLLVHSYIYYEKDLNLIDDHKWTEWAMQLVALQKEHPELSKKAPYYEEFLDFDGSTGYNLPYRMPNIVSAAEHLLAMEDKNA